MEELRFVDEHGRRVIEYRGQLQRGNTPIGSLHLAIHESHALKTVLAIGAQAPLALAGPLVLMFAGGVMLQRNQRSSALIEAQLRRIAAAPSLRETRLSTVSVKSAAGLG